MAREVASIRTKNPGAMWPGTISAKWGSTKFESLNDGTGQGNKIAIFDTWVQGICAQLDLWRTSPKYRNKRFDDAIAVWSGGNHVESYIAYVLARVPGMTRETIMNDAFWKGPMGLAFLKAQAAHEAGKPYPAPAADWAKAQAIVFGNIGPRTGTVKSVQLNVRARARASSEVVATLDQGAKVEILAEVMNGSMKWFEIPQGYVSAAYVAE